MVFTYIRTSSETFLDFWKFLFANLSKLLSTSSNELYDRKNFWEKLLSLFCRVVIKTFSDFSQKLYIRVVKNNFYVISIYFEETEFPKNLLHVWYILGLWAYFSLTFGVKFSVKLSKLIPTPSDKHFDGKQIFLKNFFILLDFGWCIFLTDDNFIVAKTSKLLSTTSGNTLIKKIFLKNTSSFFPDHEQFISWLSAKILQRGCPNCFVRVQKTFSRCGFFQLFCFWRKFDFWSIFFQTCGTNFSVKLSKLLSPCLDEHFDGKHFFGKFFNLSLDFERNIFWTWVKISQKSSLNVSCVFRKIFRKLTFRRIYWSICILRLWVKVFLNFGSFFKNLLKPHFKSSDKHFGEFLLEKFFPSVFGSNFFWSSAEFKQKSCQNQFLLVQKTSWGNRLFWIFQCFWYILELRAKVFPTFGKKNFP